MIISLKEARKLLGKEMSDKFSDLEVEKLIDDLNGLARAYIDSVKKGEIEIPLKPDNMKLKE